MALRAIQQENNTRLARHPGAKSFLPKPEVRPRAALGSIGNNVLEKQQPGKAKVSQGAVKKPLALRQPLRVAAKEEPSKPKHLATAVVPPAIQHGTKAASKSPEPEDMEVVLRHDVNDIDILDKENPQLCAEYVKEIYQYMLELERKYHVAPGYLKIQPQINARMRTILIDWLIQVHLRFTLLQETLFLTVSIIDRYLKLCPVEKSKLQLIGVTAMLIASKYEEMYAPEVRDFVYITDNTYTSAEILETERKMFKALDYSLGNPLCLHFLRRFSRAGEATPEMHTMAKFLMELCLPDHTTLEFLPSKIAAAALCLAIKIYGTGEWTPTLCHYSTYTEEDILPCVCKMARLVTNMHTVKQQAVRTKYSSSKYLRVAKAPGLQCQVIKDLAASMLPSDQ